ncbi:MAG: helix-turn-helix transcriptional regulator [Lachnospiraceae bacterium]|nr:helix-turn-helix transcriptional regulator [Lachnospiraceae bacterium]
MDKEQIASRLKSLRGGKSQQEVAAAVGITPMAISLYESGERIPRDEIKVKLAEYYGTTVDAIFFAN